MEKQKMTGGRWILDNSLVTPRYGLRQVCGVQRRLQILLLPNRPQLSIPDAGGVLIAPRAPPPPDLSSPWMKIENCYFLLSGSSGFEPPRNNRFPSLKVMFDPFARFSPFFARYPSTVTSVP